MTGVGNWSEFFQMSVMAFQEVNKGGKRQKRQTCFLCINRNDYNQNDEMITIRLIKGEMITIRMK